VIPVYDGINDQSAWRLDMLYGVKTIDPRKAHRLSASLLRKALDAQPDAIVYIDYDMGWEPEDMLKLLHTEGDAVAGTYRFKKDEEEYMGAWEMEPDLRPKVRASDGAFEATFVPAGFLKLNPRAVLRFGASYPQLMYGTSEDMEAHIKASIDLFNHGALDGKWYGEDYAFSKRWRAIGEELWIVPDLNLTHHAADKAYPGNLHEFMLRQPGGINDPERIAA
jgi:hypothetical protein